MQDAMLEYFAGEKHAALMIALIGVLALAAALLFWQPRWELRPFALVLGVFGLLELGIGVGLYLRTGPQVDGLVARHGSEPAAVVAEESARMARVQRNFVVIEVVWVTLVLAAIAVALTQRGRPTLWSASLGVLLQASFFLTFDLLAERRGSAYFTALTGATASPAAP